jgi:hypothetical protein
MYAYFGNMSSDGWTLVVYCHYHRPSLVLLKQVVVTRPTTFYTMGARVSSLIPSTLRLRLKIFISIICKQPASRKYVCRLKSIILVINKIPLACPSTVFVSVSVCLSSLPTQGTLARSTILSSRTTGLLHTSATRLSNHL